MKVTAETLTDEQIVDSLKIEGHPKVSLQDAWFAVSDEPDGSRKRDARRRVADAINARHTKESK